MTTLQTQAVECNQCAGRGFVPEMVFGALELWPCRLCGEKPAAIDFQPSDEDLERMMADDMADLADRYEELEYDSAA